MLRSFAIIALSTASVEVGVVEDDERRVAAELHRDAQHAVRRALCDSVRPTSVEPVNDSLRSRGSSNSGSIDLRPACDVVTTLSTPGRQAGLLEDLRQREHRQRRLLRRLDDHRAAGGDRRPDLAGAHRQREVPRRDQQARPDRLAHRQQARLAVRADRRSGRRSAPPPRRTSAGTRPRRSTSPRASASGLPISSVISSARSSVALDDQLERAAQDLAALTRRVRPHPACASAAAASASIASALAGVGDLDTASRRSRGPRRRGDRPTLRAARPLQ